MFHSAFRCVRCYWILCIFWSTFKLPFLCTWTLSLFNLNLNSILFYLFWLQKSTSHLILRSALIYISSLMLYWVFFSRVFLSLFLFLFLLSDDHFSFFFFLFPCPFYLSIVLFIYISSYFSNTHTNIPLTSSHLLPPFFPQFLSPSFFHFFSFFLFFHFFSTGTHFWKYSEMMFSRISLSLSQLFAKVY